MTSADSLASGWRRLLPPTRRPALMLVVVVVSALWLALAVRHARSLMQDVSITDALATVFFAFLAAGLWRLNRAARLIVVVIFYVALPVVILGVLNPFMMMDVRHATGHEPSVWRLVAVVVPIAMFLMVCLHILGIHKAEFGRRRETAAGDAEAEPAARP